MLVAEQFLCRKSQILYTAIVAPWRSNFDDYCNATYTALSYVPANRLEMTNCLIYSPLGICAKHTDFIKVYTQKKRGLEVFQG